MDDKTKFSAAALRVLEELITQNFQDCIDEWEKCNGKA